MATNRKDYGTRIGARTVGCPETLVKKDQMQRKEKRPAQKDRALAFFCAHPGSHKVAVTVEMGESAEVICQDGKQIAFRAIAPTPSRLACPPHIRQSAQWDACRIVASHGRFHGEA